MPTSAPRTLQRIGRVLRVCVHFRRSRMAVTWQYSYTAVVILRGLVWLFDLLCQYMYIVYKQNIITVRFLFGGRCGGLRNTPPATMIADAASNNNHINTGWNIVQAAQHWEAHVIQSVCSTMAWTENGVQLQLNGPPHWMWMSLALSEVRLWIRFVRVNSLNRGEI